MAFKDESISTVYGSEVKALEGGKVGGYLVMFSDENNPDLADDFFDKRTDFGEHKSSPVLYQHGLDEILGPRILGKGSLKLDEVGVWLEAQLNLRDDYEKAVYELAKKKKLGWSSGTATHLVKRVKVGDAYHIETWPLGLDASMTPTPAEPRTGVMELKNIPIKSILRVGAMVDEEHNKQKEKAMNDQEKKALVDAEVKAELKRLEDEKEAKAKAEAEAQEIKEKEKAELKAMIEAEIKAQSAVNAGQPAPGKGAKHGGGKSSYGDSGIKAFAHFCRTGDPGGIRTGEAYEAACRTNVLEVKTDYHLEGSQYQGQEVVPTEVYNAVIERRDPVSIMRSAGAMIVQANSNAVNIPIEKANPQVFGIVDIDGSNTFTTLTQQPLDKLAATVYVFTYNIPYGLDTFDDSVVDLDGWMNRYVGRGLALTENKYFVTGSGSSQPQGLVAGSTKGVDAASATAVTPAEIISLYHKLTSEYRDSVSWFMTGASEGTIRGLTASTSTPFTGTGGYAGGIGNTGYPQGVGWLVSPSSRVFNAADMDAIAASKKSIVVANAGAAYAIVDRKFLTVLRDPYSEASKGIVNLWWYARFTGGVVNAVAAQHILHPSA